MCGAGGDAAGHELAGDYADAFALRGDDSMQLASARALRQGAGEALHLACFGARLVKAARVLVMQVMEAE